MLSLPRFLSLNQLAPDSCDPAWRGVVMDFGWLSWTATHAIQACSHPVAGWRSSGGSVLAPWE